MSSKNKNAKFKCLYCDNRYTREDLVAHINDKHEEMIPEGYTALRLVFNYVNRKPTEYHGRCTECQGPTNWDENKGRYDRQCQSPKCKQSFIKNFEKNMMRTKGVTRITLTPEGQQKMLANRRISGKYKFQNGVEKTYTGSYELKALKFMDQVMNINPDDILCPGPILQYELDGKAHFYITDFYYQPYNLVIEVKDGGVNPNKRSMPEYRKKQIAKEEFIVNNTDYNYLRLTDNDLSQLMAVFSDLKYQLVENTGERTIHINERSLLEGAPDNTDPDDRENVYSKLMKVLKDNDIEAKVSKKSLDKFINYEKNDFGDYDLCISVGTDNVKKAIKISKDIIEPYGGKLIEDNYGTMFLSVKESSIWTESMNALFTGYIPGLKDTGSVYVVNYTKNNVFSGEEEKGYGVTDNIKLTNLICRNKEGILTKAPDNLLYEAKYDVYMIDKSKEEVSKLLAPYIDTFVEEGFLYETLFGKKMYTYDQIMTEENAVQVLDYYESMKVFSEIVYNFLTTNKKVSSGYIYSNENSKMILDINSNDKSCVSYFDIKNNIWCLESVEFPDLYIKSESKLDEGSLKRRIFESLIRGGKYE